MDTGLQTGGDTIQNLTNTVLESAHFRGMQQSMAVFLLIHAIKFAVYFRMRRVPNHPNFARSYKSLAWANFATPLLENIYSTFPMVGEVELH